ncbi:MAG: hypothetical protein IJ193_03785 [Bacilli bacterium]|nr:hypothetical protein [Bacilli bacterium]
MKKYLSIIIVLIVVSLISAGGIYYLYSLSNETNGEVYIKENKDLYDKAIAYLTKQNEEAKDPDRLNDRYHFFITYDGLGMTEKDGYQYAYMWVLGESYFIKDSKVQSGSGYSMFYKFQFQDNEVVSYEIPKDGSYYTKSIIDMCIDSKMSRKVLRYNSKLSLEKQVREYYS